MSYIQGENKMPKNCEESVKTEINFCLMSLLLKLELQNELLMFHHIKHSTTLRLILFEIAVKFESKTLKLVIKCCN